MLAKNQKLGLHLGVNTGRVRSPVGPFRADVESVDENVGFVCPMSLEKCAKGAVFQYNVLVEDTYEGTEPDQVQSHEG